MDILSYFHGLGIKNDFFRPRKATLPDEGSFLLYGARGTGKTVLIIEYLQSLDEESYLYLDCQDPIFALEDLDEAMIEAFLEEEIGTLVLDHYYEGFLEHLPNAERLIVICRDPSSDLKEISTRIELFPLDYEEFLSFERSPSSTAGFTHFLKVGTLPAVAHIQPQAFTLGLREFFYASFDENESRLMLILARYQGHRLTTHQIYTYAKEYFRISKDWVYGTIKRFREEKLILFVEDITTKGAQKMILYDFALAKYLSKSQPFPATFDALTVLALFKRQIPFVALGIHGYLVGEDELVVPSPFESEEQFWKKSYDKMNLYKKHGISRVTVVTVSNQYSFTLGEVAFEALPFYEWSVVLPHGSEVETE